MGRFKTWDGFSVDIVGGVNVFVVWVAEGNNGC